MSYISEEIVGVKGGVDTQPKGESLRTVDSEAITWKNIRRSWQAYLLLLPVFVLLLVFNYYPPVLGLVRAFYEWAPLRTPVFVGLENFNNYLFYYPESARELTNIAKFLVYSMFAHVGMPFLMAELVYNVRSQSMKELYRLLIVIPMLVPSLVSLLLWRHIYDPAFGPINALLEGVGLDGLARNWLGDPATALYAVMAVNFPWVATVGTLICLGGLSQISSSIVDSCLLDGCTGIRRVWHIDLPLTLGQIRLLMILAMLAATQSFAVILVLTRGGPGYVTSVPGLTMYTRAFNTMQFGYASAIGLMLFIIGIALTYLISKTVRTYDERA